MERRRAITINRGRSEVERAWHDFAFKQSWQEHLLSTELVPLAHSRGTLLRVRLGEGTQMDDVELALRRFKALQEAGEIPSTDGQPAGGRGLAERVKESLTPRSSIKKEAA